LNTKSDHKALKVTPARNATTKLLRVQHHEVVLCFKKVKFKRRNRP